jgi:fused signal recognition particle receptor
MSEINAKTFVILIVGVNGAGKTTSIGKLAKSFQQAGKTVMLAAADTYRAAAVEQLKVWGERNDVPVVAQSTGSDAASVIFDAYDSAKAKGIDILIADTAGRLHTQKNLMQELEKIDRVIKKQDPEAPHETMLVVDGTAGQNALNQAVDFNKLLNITGITITKLDGTAKGGVLFSISNELKLPIRFIGVGEGIDDLRVFNAKKFVDAIFN